MRLDDLLEWAAAISRH